MSSASTISLANRSLLSVGARASISSLQEGSVEANAISTLFVPTFQQLARSAAWNCLKKQATLSLLAAAQGTPENPLGTTLPLPPTPYLYSYALPSDCLQVRYIVPSFPNSTPTGTTPLTTASVTASSWFPGAMAIPFSVSYATDTNNNPITVILCNQTQAQAVYTVDQPNPVVWDSLFQAAFVASLAAYLVPALSLDLPLMDRSIKAAEEMIRQARVRDGNEGITSVNRNADWMTARMIGGYGYTGGSGYAPALCGDYGSMTWPG